MRVGSRTCTITWAVASNRGQPRPAYCAMPEIRLGTGCPQRMVDHALARDRALTALAMLDERTLNRAVTR
jgi:hypothetical protein